MRFIIYIVDKRHLIKFDENDSLNLMISFYQVKRTRHLIKLFKKKTISLLFDEQSSAAIFDVKNLVLQKIIILCEDKYVCVKLF
jgi:hypothetical protein